MAIHFNYIKGLNGDVQELSKDTTSTNSNDVYTYIKWAGRTIGESFSANCKFLPEIKISKLKSLTTNDSSTQFSLGRIITSSAYEQYIERNFCISNNQQLRFSTSPISDGGNAAGEQATGFGTIHWDNNGCFRINSYKDLVLGTEADCSLIFGSMAGQANFANTHLKSNNTYIYGKTVFYAGITDKGVGTGNKVTIEAGHIEAQDYIDALFFNATSDKRAKTHIQHWDASALDIVTKLPIYEFNYKNNDTPSIGVIAQDAAEFDDCFTDFSLVDNANATGEDGDYMTIKESKLVYILWKAVQEQQEQIIQLQAELNTIISSIKNR